MFRCVLIICYACVYMSNELHGHGSVWGQLSAYLVIEEFELIKYVVRNFQFQVCGHPRTKHENKNKEWILECANHCSWRFRKSTNYFKISLCSS